MPYVGDGMGANPSMEDLRVPSKRWQWILDECLEFHMLRLANWDLARMVALEYVASPNFVAMQYAHIDRYFATLHVVCSLTYSMHNCLTILWLSWPIYATF